MLFLGKPDPVLERDLASSRLPARSEARLLSAEAVETSTGVLLRPVQPLPVGTEWTLAIRNDAQTLDGGRVQSAALFAMKTGTGLDVGAQLQDSWPPAAMSGIPTRLPFVGVHFDGSLAPGAVEHMRLHPRDQPEQPPTRPRLSPCPPLGWPAGQCVVWKLSDRLEPETEYRVSIAAEATDATGAPVGSLEFDFVTAGHDEDNGPPRWLALECEIDETPVEAGCALVDDRSVSLRLSASEPVRISWATSGGATGAVAARGEAVLDLRGLGAGTLIDGALSATDLSGQTLTLATRMTTAEELAALSIVEVSSNPVGSEPDQEYVELLSSSPVSLSLQGYSLSDRADAIGDVIESPRALAPGQRALLVAEGFDADALPTVAPGVPLIRLGSSLASGGLRNSGERLFLRDAHGRRIATVPAFDVSEGECIQRSDEATLRARDRSDFYLGECGPGFRPP